MNYQIPYEEIRAQVLDFMRELGMFPAKSKDEYLILDGQIHRYTIEGDKPSKKNGAYLIHADGVPNGFVQDWKNNDEKSKWIFKFPETEEAKKKREYFSSKEYREKIEAEQKKRSEELIKKQTEASENARKKFEKISVADNSHPYLLRKQVQNHGLKIDDEYLTTPYHSHENGTPLVVPLRDIDGNITSLQFIFENGEKRFLTDAPRDNNFFSIDLDKLSEKNNVLLLCEGYATGAKIYELTGYPVVCAMNSGSIDKVATSLLKKYTDAKIIVMADNDLQTQEKRGFNPGIIAAENTCKNGHAIGYLAPPFPFNDIGTDWDDYAIRYGDDLATGELKKFIWWTLLTPEEKEEYEHRRKLFDLLGDLNPAIEIPPQEFIGGLFPRGFLSAVVAPSGTGKTIFMQKCVSDLSMGGTFFDGFVEDEPPRKCLIFAGEAGYELLLRRGASLKWPINPNLVKVVDQYKFESNNESIMLDEPEGLINIKRIIDMVKPDIIFFDTVMSFHSKDENKATDMKPIIRELNDIARENNIAIVLNHHSRKRTAKERSLSLNQDDVIGSSIFNRLVSLIIGIEPYEKNNENGTTLEKDKGALLVRPLKTWFSTFMPFTYKITEDINGHSVMETDLSPEGAGISSVAVWNYLQKTFTPGEWFSLPSLILSDIEGSPPIWQVRRIINDLVKKKKIRKRGATKSLEYSLIGFYDKDYERD